MPQIKSLVLHDCNENQKILSKLPDWLASRWNRWVIEPEDKTKSFPSFSRFVKFLTREAKIACNPVTSLHALKFNEVGKGKVWRNHDTRAEVLTVHSCEMANAGKCAFCDRPGHGIGKCRRFMEKNVPERIKSVHMNGLCFGCLTLGHRAKVCDSRSICETCQKKHHVYMKTAPKKQRSFHSRNSHGRSWRTEDQTARNKETAGEATSNRVTRDKNNAQTSTIVPVWVSTADEPNHDVLFYALLVTQSDTTFIQEESSSSWHKNGTCAAGNLNNEYKSTVPCQMSSSESILFR